MCKTGANTHCFLKVHIRKRKTIVQARVLNSHEDWNGQKLAKTGLKQTCFILLLRELSYKKLNIFF